MPEQSETQAVEIYTNELRIIGAMYEICVELQRMTPQFSEIPGRQPDLRRDVLARVRLAPGHAKAFAVLLLQHVVEHERQYGTLPLTPEVQKAWDVLIEHKR